jgi:nicotinate-nucleotide adenylyltransferase
METIGLFGGTFDPVHLGHLRAAEEVRRLAGLDRVLFIPSFLPPHKGPGTGASPEDRLRMVELACRGRAGLEASPIEVEAREKSYSILTLRKIRGLSPDARIFFILGVDAFLDIGTWREYERVLEECFFIVMGRPGFELDRAGNVLGGRLRDSMGPLADGKGVAGALPPRTRIFLLPIRALDISSTEIREKISRGETLDGLVPAPVDAYIREHELYRGR